MRVAAQYTGGRLNGFPLYGIQYLWLISPEAIPPLGKRTGSTRITVEQLHFSEFTDVLFFHEEMCSALVWT